MILSLAKTMDDRKIYKQMRVLVVLYFSVVHKVEIEL